MLDSASEGRLIAVPAKDFGAAKRQFLELYGSTAVMNTYLKIAVLCLSVACSGLTWLNIRSLALVRDTKPVIIRINEVGRAEVVNAGELSYKPQEAEIKYFLIQFVTRYYSRIRATVKDDYARALYFIETRLADSITEADRKSKTIETFLVSTHEEIDIKVKNVSIEDLRKPPYRATVDFEKIYYSSGAHQELRREKFVANVVFIVKDRVPNSMIPVNPLGLTITYFREDQAFQ